MEKTMTINLMEFLDESARYRLNILQIFDLRKGQFISSDLLIEFLGISKFKLNNYLTELEKDLGETEDTRLHRLARGEIEIVHLTNEVIRQLRLKYVKASETFIFFQELVLYGTSAEKFAQKNFLSRSKAYLIKNNLGKIVRSAGVKVGDSELRGDETAVRNLLFEVYYYFFNGIESPFPQELQTEIRSYIELIRSVFHIERILTRLIKLELFLGIVLIRWKQKRFIIIKKAILNMNVIHQILGDFPLYLKKVTQEYQLPQAILHDENVWLFRFLLAEECLPLSEYQDVLIEHTELMEITNQQVTFVFDQITFEDVPTTEIDCIAEKLKMELLLINFKLDCLSYTQTTFISKDQIVYFAESYPQFHMCAQKLAKITHQRLPQTNENNLYYDYLFTIISSIPPVFVKDKVFVCVDFSKGRAYSEFIAQNIQSFRSLNVEIQKKVNNQTQIYISDFMVDKLVCRQIIWKNPPSDEDWMFFGDTVVKVRKEK